jgi:hypothetical protein
VSRQAVLVLGMHRSGTSVLAGLLAHLGAQAPRALMPPDANNPQGYWESQLFHDFHERLLAMAGTRWDSWTQVPSEWLRSDASAQFGEECQSLLQTEFGEAPLFLLKDPRMCRLMPFWLPLMESFRITPSAVLVIRRPIEVARSLERRNALSRITSLLMWLRHVLDAEVHTRNIQRSIVRCEDLLERWSPIAAQIGRDLNVDWPRRTAEHEAQIAHFMASGFKETQTEPAGWDVPEPLRGLLQRTETALAALRSDARQSESAMAELDEVRLEFGRLALIVDAVAGGLDERRKAEVSGLERQLSESRSELLNVQATILEVSVAAEDLRKQLGDSSGRLHQAGIDRGELEAQIRQTRKELAGLERQNAEIVEHRESLEAQVIHLDRCLIHLEAERKRLVQQVEALYASKSWRVTAPLRALWGIVPSKRRP